MSMTVYTYTLDENGENPNFSEGPNFSNTNACMIFRSLGLQLDEGATSFDANELLGIVTMARAVPPIDDSGMESIRHGNFINCGVRPGYFADAYEQIAEVCEIAIQWGTKVVVA